MANHKVLLFALVTSLWNLSRAVIDALKLASITA